MSAENVRIAIDAMGGDRAPRVVVEGVIEAMQKYDYHVVLVGDERKIKKFLWQLKKESQSGLVVMTFVKWEEQVMELQE